MEWNERYAENDLPWDTGEPDPLLVELVGEGSIAPGRALEVGCGTGTNALYLAGAGFDVLGVDLSPIAIERARSKQGDATGCVFEVLDFLDADPPGGPFDLVFDRGCFHTFDEAERRGRFAARVAQLLSRGGRWVSLIGSTEGPEREHGPPRRSARDVVDAIEPVLFVESLRAVRFHADIPSPARGWLTIARVRDVPAQPSTLR